MAEIKHVDGHREVLKLLLLISLLVEFAVGQGCSFASPGIYLFYDPDVSLWVMFHSSSLDSITQACQCT